MKLLTLMVLAMLAVTAQGQILQEKYLRDATPEELQDWRIVPNKEFMLCIGGTNCLGTMILKTDAKWYVKITNWCDRIPASEQERAVKDLAKGGVICKVLEHIWRGGRPGEGQIPGTQAYISFADYHPGTSFRTCKICGKCESKTEGEWK